MELFSGQGYGPALQGHTFDSTSPMGGSGIGEAGVTTSLLSFSPGKSWVAVGCGCLWPLIFLVWMEDSKSLGSHTSCVAWILQCGEPSKM